MKSRKKVDRKTERKAEIPVRRYDNLPPIKGNAKESVGIPVKTYDPLCSHVGVNIPGTKLYASSLRGGISNLKVPFLILESQLIRRFVSVKVPCAHGLSMRTFGEFSVNVSSERPWIFWPWPDMGVPEFSPDIVDKFRELVDLSSNEGLEVACYGGHGRTGTVLAILSAVILNVPTENAVGNLRRIYCSKAVETPEQEKFVKKVLCSLRGEEYKEPPQEGVDYFLGSALYKWGPKLGEWDL